MTRITHAEPSMANSQPNARADSLEAPEWWWSASDGKQLPYRRWAPEGGTTARPAGLVIAVHGIGGAASDFDTSARALADNGFVVYGLELRGQGNDPDLRRRGDIRHARLWFNDLREFHQLATESHPSLPTIWFGESLGALIALHTAVGTGLGGAGDNGPHAQPHALVLSVPVVGFRDSLPKWQEWLLRALARVAPTKRIDLASLDSGNAEPVPLTTDEVYLEHMMQQPHYLQVFSLRLLRHVGELVVTSHEAAARWQRPVMVQYAGSDIFTPAAASESFIHAFPEDVRQGRLYERSHHLLFHDRQSAEAVADIIAWLGGITAGR